MSIYRTVVKFLGTNLMPNLTSDYLSYQSSIDQIKRDYDIDLIVDLAPVRSSSDYAGLIGSLTRTNSTEYDIYLIDVVWTGQFADHFLDMAPFIPESVKSQHVQNIYNANNIAGRQVAVPFFADYGVMYYRTDLLAKYNFSGPPQTWEEMERMMSVIVPGERLTNPSFQGYLGQLKGKYLTSIASGTMVESNKSVSVNTPAAVEIVTRIKSWLNPPKSYTPLSGLSFAEDESANVWLKGNALFLRNWPHIYPQTSNAVDFPKNADGSSAFALTRLPGGTREQSAAALGGWHLAINKNTKNVDAAVKAIQGLISRDVQFERYKNTGRLPTISSIYSDPEFCRLNPQCGAFASLQAAARPAAVTSPYYLTVSEQIYLAANKILRDEVPVIEGLRQMRVSIEKAMGTYVEPAIDLGPPIFVTYRDPLGLAFMITAALLAFVAISLFCIIVTYRNHKLLTSSSPLFMLIMVTGTLIAHGAIFAFTGEPSNVSCILQPWLVVMSFSLTLAALVTKNWRILKIFRNKRMKKMNLNDSELLKTCLALISINVVVLTIWTAIDPPQKSLISLSTAQFYSCKSRNSLFGWGMIGGLVGYSALMLGAGVYLAYCTRNVHGAFNESKYIGYTIYTIVLVNIILLPLSFIDTMGAQFQYIFRGIAIELSAVTVTMNMFVPKIIDLFRHKDDNVWGDSSRLSSAGGAIITGERSFGSTSTVKKDVKNLVSDRTEGPIYVRFGKTRFAMNLSSWKDMTMIVIPTFKFIAMFPNTGSEKSGMSELGIALQVESIVVEDILTVDDQFMFGCALNGSFYQIQVASAEVKEKWMKVLNEIVGCA
ncbi:hypothetical protein HDU67_010187 [Dinochytrium kinnereticum]|nr:hypothetical protein HDU67_010187 [Dinochytrium kinnereticum]